VRQCAEGRQTSHLSPEAIYTDVCFDLAQQWGFMRPEGDHSNPGRWARHAVSEMGLGLDAGQRMFNSLGYPLKKVKQRKGFSTEEQVDF
jgi:hypothetical protein